MKNSFEIGRDRLNRDLTKIEFEIEKIEFGKKFDRKNSAELENFRNSAEFENFVRDAEKMKKNLRKFQNDLHSYVKNLEKSIADAHQETIKGLSRMMDEMEFANRKNFRRPARIGEWITVFGIWFKFVKPDLALGALTALTTLTALTALTTLSH